MDNYIIKLKKPFAFEGTEYKELDLNGLEDLTAADLMKAHKEYKAAEGTSALPEMEYGYIFRLAAMAAELPLELFLELPAPDAVQVKVTVSNFLAGTD